jgi:hypothetical protein
MADLAKIRIANALLLFEQFKDTNCPGTAPLLGLEKAFSAHVQISAAQWSQLKGGHRSIGATLARQIESRCGKPGGWLDQPHGAAGRPAARGSGAATPADAREAEDGPRDAAERFAVALFLTAYRANPQEVNARLLDLVQAQLARDAKPPRRAAAPVLRVASLAKKT